jgi:hypothetical protein
MWPLCNLSLGFCNWTYLGINEDVYYDTETHTVRDENGNDVWVYLPEESTKAAYGRLVNELSSKMTKSFDELPTLPHIGNVLKKIMCNWRQLQSAWLTFM